MIKLLKKVYRVVVVGIAIGILYAIYFTIFYFMKRL